jgi:hypothetical protein
MRHKSELGSKVHGANTADLVEVAFAVVLCKFCAGYELAIRSRDEATPDAARTTYLRNHDTLKRALPDNEVSRVRSRDEMKAVG